MGGGKQAASGEDYYRRGLENELGASDGARGYRGFHDNPGGASSAGELFARPVTLLFVVFFGFLIAFAAIKVWDGSARRWWFEYVAPSGDRPHASRSEMGIFDIAPEERGNTSWGEVSKPVAPAPEPESEAPEMPPVVATTGPVS